MEDVPAVSSVPWWTGAKDQWWDRCHPSWHDQKSLQRLGQKMPPPHPEQWWIHRVSSSDEEEKDIHQFFSTSWYSNFTLLYFSLHYWLNQWTVYVNEMSHVINYELIVINCAWITACCNDMLQSIVFFVAQTRALIIFLFMLIRLTTPLVLSSMASICLIDSTVRPRASLVVETRDQVMGLGFTWNLNQFLISASSQVWCAKPNLTNLR